MTPAGLGWRAGARVVDLALAAWLVGVVLVELSDRLLGADPLEGGAFRFRLVVGLVVIMTEVVPIAIRGVSLGKAVLGLRVVPTDGDQRWPGPVRSLLRSLVLYGAALVPLVGGVLVLAVLLPVVVTPQRRGLHDRLAGTMVVAVAERGGGDDGGGGGR